MENLTENQFYNHHISQEYLEILKSKSYSHNTIRNYEVSFRQAFDYFSIADKRYDTCTIGDMHSFVKYLENLKLADVTINSKLSAMKSLFVYMASIKARSDIPLNPLMYKKIHWETPQIITAEQERMYFNFLKNHCRMDQLIGARVMLYAGLRKEEVINMDLNRDLEVQGEKVYIHVRKSKSKRQRICPIFSASTAKDLLDIRKRFFKFGTYNLNVNMNSWLYTTKLFNQKYNIFVSPHILRHTYATRRFEEGLDLNTVRLLLGHQSVNTTLLYIHANTNIIYNLI